MNDSSYRIIIFLGTLIATLLVVLIVVLLTSDDPDPVTSAASTSVTTAATATSSPPATSGTTAAPATTSAPATTAAPATSAATPTTAPPPVYLVPQGFGPIVRGADENDLVASGDLVFDGWDATDPPDGYWCGWGSGAGPQSGLVGTQIFDFGIAVVYAIDSSVMTPEGISLSSSEANIVAAYGPPDEQHAGPYVPTESWIYYQFGDHGYRFIFDGGSMLQMQAGDWEKLHLGEGCL